MRDITLCHPRLQIKAAQWVEACEKQRITVKIGETLRRAAEQDALYAQGRTKPGSVVTNAKGSEYRSQHQWGIAYDFYLSMDIDGDGKSTDDSYNDSTGMFGKAADLAKTVGLAWGGDWSSIVDAPHIYLPDWGSTPTDLIKQYKTPDAFIKTWERQTGWIEDGIGRWYSHSDGSYVKNDWEKIEGQWYWFNGAGYAVEHEWYEDKEKWYYLGTTGAMVTGLQIIKGTVYYFDQSGAMATGTVTLTANQDGVLQ